MSAPIKTTSASSASASASAAAHAPSVSVAASASSISTFKYLPINKLQPAEMEKFKDQILKEIAGKELASTQMLSKNRQDDEDGLEEMLKNDANTSYSHIVLCGEELAGAVIARPGQEAIGNKQNNCSPITIENFFVLSKFQGKEVGRNLIHKVAEAMAPNKHDTILMTVFKTNEKALKFFDLQGFVYADKEADAPWKCFLLKGTCDAVLKATHSSAPAKQPTATASASAAAH
jgi:ribosomal protein S18 acetylase RimI-like enzyme